MRTIKIQKIGITDLDTDAIVNAANEGLWAGGGVSFSGQRDMMSCRMPAIRSVIVIPALL